MSITYEKAVRNIVGTRVSWISCDDNVLNNVHVHGEKKGNAYFSNFIISFLNFIFLLKSTACKLIRNRTTIPQATIRAQTFVVAMQHAGKTSHTRNFLSRLTERDLTPLSARYVSKTRTQRP